MTRQTLKVVVAAPLYPPEIGGPATHAVLLEREMPSRNIDIETIPFAEVRHFPKVLRHGMYAYRLWRQARRADVVYALDPVSVGLPTYIASVFSGKPYVLRVGGDYAWEQGVQRFGIKDTLDEFLERSALPFSLLLLKKVQSFVACRARTVIAPSAYLAGVVARWGVARSSIIVAYSAPERLPHIEKKMARLQLSLPEDMFLVLSAGRLVPWKGFKALIEAFGQTSLASARLVIAGDGPQRDFLAACAAELRLSEKVVFIGGVPREQLAVWLSAADCFVLNTKYEGLSHQLMEALMIGTPVITTEVGGNKELIDDGTSGLFVSVDNVAALAEAIMRIRTDELLAERLREGGFAKLMQFDTEASLESIADALLYARTKRL